MKQLVTKPGFLFTPEEKQLVERLTLAHKPKDKMSSPDSRAVENVFYRMFSGNRSGEQVAKWANNDRWEDGSRRTMVEAKMHALATLLAIQVEINMFDATEYLLDKLTKHVGEDLYPGLAGMVLEVEDVPDAPPVRDADDLAAAKNAADETAAANSTNQE